VIIRLIIMLLAWNALASIGKSGWGA